MVVDLEKLVFREGNCQGRNENYEPIQLNTLLERFYVKFKQTWLNLTNDYSITSKVIRTQTEQFLELFCRTLNFFVPYRYENIIGYYWFDRSRLF